MIARSRRAVGRVWLHRRLPRPVAGLEHGLDVAQGVRQDLALLGLGAFYPTHDMLIDEPFLDCPGPQRSQPSVVVEHSLGRKVVQASQKGGDLGRADLSYRRIAPEERLEAAEGRVIVPQRVPGQPPGMRSDEVAFDGSRESDAIFIHGTSGSRVPVPIMTKQYR
jgi:hypothetical protein